MKKIFLIPILLISLTMYSFGSSPSSYTKDIETFFNKGTYIKITDNANNIHYITRNLITSISVMSHTPVITINTCCGKSDKSYYLDNYELKTDSNGNLIITYKGK